MTDLLVSEDGRSYFINCRFEAERLFAGAVYIAPDTESPLKLNLPEGGNLTIVLPPSAVSQPTEMVATRTSFFID